VDKRDPFRGALDEDGRREFEGLGKIRRYRKGTTLFVEGDRSTCVVAIRAGRVKVVTTTADGHELVLGLRSVGALVGELSSLEEGIGRRSATVVAIDAVAAQAIPNDEFNSFLERHPRALLALTRIIIGRLHDADRRRAEFGTYDTLGRLARVLVELAASSTVISVHGVRIEPPLAQHELAGLVGASRESVVRALGELRRRNLVETGRRRLVVRDLTGLAQLTA
jgi:CRP-like cAMP-binding protein